MRKRKVWRYYCEFCKKAGCSGGHIRRHEERCTMNPNRDCGMCKTADNEQVDIKDVLAILPDPTEYITHDDYFVTFHANFESDVEKAMPKLRRLTGNCPACIMAALRQRGIPVPVVVSFDFSSEIKLFWADINQENERLRVSY